MYQFFLDKMDIAVIKGSKRCCVGGCDNDQRYPQKLIIKDHVQELKWHRVPRPNSKNDETEKKRNLWVKMISKGRKDFAPQNETFVCSNHFIDGKPTLNNPAPTLYLTVRENASSPQRERKAPAKRQKSSEILMPSTSR